MIEPSTGCTGNPSRGAPAIDDNLQGVHGVCVIFFGYQLNALAVDIRTDTGIKVSDD